MARHSEASRSSPIQSPIQLRLTSLRSQILRGEETWDQICKDFDTATELLPETSSLQGLPNNELGALVQGRGYALRRFCRQVQRHRHRPSHRGRLEDWREGHRIRQRRAAAASQMSRKPYKAAREVMKSGRYSYKKKWSAEDKDAQYQNMVDMFSDVSSPEVASRNIPTRPSHTVWTPTAGLSYSGIRFAQVRVLRLISWNCSTGSTATQRDHPCDRRRVQHRWTLPDVQHHDGFLQDAEPRLRAYVILPGDIFRNVEIEIRAGIYTGETPVSPLGRTIPTAGPPRTTRLLPQFGKTLFIRRTLLRHNRLWRLTGWSSARARCQRAVLQHPG